MIVGVPIFAVFYAGVKSLINRILHKKNLPTDLAPYMTVGRIEESMAFTEYVPPVKKKSSVKTKTAVSKPNDPNGKKESQEGKK